MRYGLVNTFDANARGRADWRNEARDVGRLVSRHHTIEAASAAAERLQGDVERSHGPNAGVPVLIVEPDAEGLQLGHMVARCDCVEQAGGGLDVHHDL